MAETSQNVIHALSRALQRIRSTPPRIIASPATQPRRAAVALIIRIVPPPGFSSSNKNYTTPNPAPSLTEFFMQEWVKDPAAHAEILFIRRQHPDGSRTVVQNKPRNIEDAHVAYPGGRMEEGDEGGLYTAMRQTWEEIGIDLAESNFTLVGQLDDREITTSLGKRLLMILSPFVFLQVTPYTPTPDPTEGTYLHWVPIASLLASTTSIGIPSNATAAEKQPQKVMRRRPWTTVTVDISSRLAPRHASLLRLGVRLLIGSMQFNAITLDPATESGVSHGEKGEKQGLISETLSGRGRGQLKLWGLSLGMTLDLLAFMELPSSPFSNDYPRDEVSGMGNSIAPSMTSVLPRFSHPDVNFWIWVFGRRYRDVLRAWAEATSAAPTSPTNHLGMELSANDRRINWTGTAVNQFYAAVRKALVVVLVLRTLGILIAMGVGAWWIFFQ